MPSAQILYESSVKTLPAIEQLRFASMILDRLACDPHMEAQLSDTWGEGDIRDLAVYSLDRADQAVPAEGVNA